MQESNIRIRLHSYNEYGILHRHTIHPSKVGPWADPEGGQGLQTPPPPPPENLQTFGFLSNTSPDPLINHKATKPEFNVGPSSARQQNAI